MTIKKGDKIKVEYTGTFEDGTVFDSTTHKDHTHPIEFEVGAKQLIKGFDDAVVGMKVDEEKNITIKPEEAYGERKEELSKEIPRDKLPKEPEPKVGMALMMNSPDGQQFPAVIKSVDEEKIVIDLNHPLAGKTLNFKIKIVEINSS
jgi:FKBP-type peptidyl-prolyl cis-trans isomerase 2